MAFVESRGFALPDTVYSTPPLRNAQNLGWWWPSDQRCEPSQVLSDGSENKLILGAAWATQSKSTELQDALQVCEPHLDLLALTSRLLKALGASERPGNVSGMLVDVARDLASWFLWTALRFERANIAVELAGTIQLLDETTDSVQLHDYNFEATLDFFSYA